MKFLVTERQIVEYTWEIDSDDLDDNGYALDSTEGVPDNATCTLVDSTTTYKPI